MAHPEPTYRQYVEWVGPAPHPDCPVCQGGGWRLEPHGELTACRCCNPDTAAPADPRPEPPFDADEVPF